MSKKIKRTIGWGIICTMVAMIFAFIISEASEASIKLTLAYCGVIIGAIVFAALMTWLFDSED